MAVQLRILLQMKSFLEAEARSHDPERIKTQVKHMTDVFETTASELGGKAEVTVEQSYPGFKINDNEAVVKIAQESARNLGLSANTIISGGGSDGSIINTFGIPSVILGVGYEKSIQQMRECRLNH